MTTLTMMVSLPLVGLAVDVTVLYMIRGKLYQAVDAAALPELAVSGKAPMAGLKRPTRETAATKFFNANFPSGYWGTSASASHTGRG